jgi:hypothetical protein
MRDDARRPARDGARIEWEYAPQLLGEGVELAHFELLAQEGG